MCSAIAPPDKWQQANDVVGTGITVSIGVAMAVSVACLATALDPQRDAVVHVAATVPVDPAHLAASAEPVALEQGRVYYVQLCMSCHGTRGEGRGEWAHRVIPRPANLTAARTQRRSDAELFQIISEPRPGTPMIGWKRQLSEEQRRQLVAYVRHLGGAARETRH